MSLLLLLGGSGPGGGPPDPPPAAVLTSTLTAAVRRSHQAVVAVEVLENGEVIDTLTGEAGVTVGGTVTEDAKAASRGRFDLTLIDDGSLGLVPTTAADLLAPYGHEVRISRGAILPDGNPSVVELGTFRLDRCGIDDTAQGLVITLSGMDRSVRVIDARFEEPYQVLAGTPVETAILDVVSFAIPDVVTSFPGSLFVTPQLFAAEGDDRWAFAQQSATACGLDLHFARDGSLTLTPLSQAAAVMTIAEGEDGVLLSVSREWTRENTYNRVIATGENTGEATPARGVWTDDNPLSPTYYYGPFGRVPRFFQSQFIVTGDQALDAATAIGVKQLGTTQSVSFGTIVDPTLKPDDTVRITRLRAGIDEDHVIDTLTIPLGADQPMTGTTRARQVTS